MSPVFCNPKTIFDPWKNRLSPIFRLPDRLNPYRAKGVEIYAVPFYTAAMPNVKALMVRHMFESAAESGTLNGVHTIVEATSGNTGLTMCLIAPYYGARVVTVVERDLAPGKLDQLRLAGADIVYPDAGSGTIEAAKRLGGQKGWYNFNQYSSHLNVEAHSIYTGPHIFRETHGRITVFSNGVGTAGTCLGVKAYFEKAGVKARVIGVVCAEGNPVPGLRSRRKLDGVELDWRSLELIEATNREAYLLSLKLCQSGLMAGPSSGMALAGLLRFLSERESSNFAGLRNSYGAVVAVFGCGDTPIPYLDKYTTILDGEEFEPLRLS